MNSQDKPTGGKPKRSEELDPHGTNPTEQVIPGERGAFPPGTFRRLPPDPQGDENREPPSNAPTPPP